MLAADGVVQAETYIEVGETIRPVRATATRRGYVIAVGEDSGEGASPSGGGRVEVPVEVEA